MFFYKTLYNLERKFPRIIKGLLQFTLRNISFYLKIRSKIFGPRKSVLYAGQAYYNGWYLSRSLRNLGWKADVLNWDMNPATQIYYHGEDFKFEIHSSEEVYKHLFFYLKALINYDIFHFSNANGIQFGSPLNDWFKIHFGEFFEIYFLKSLGKKVIYSNNGCLDGVSKTSFSKWGTVSVCSICRWKNNSQVCEDKKNLDWGAFRNKIADYQCLFGGNRVDYNYAPSVHEVPEFYCLNEEIWHPNIEIPNEFKLQKSEHTIYVYHTVGNKKERTDENGVNIKSTHIYLPLLEKLKSSSLSIELISPENVPNKDVRYYQVQADIFLEMLTYGWYGANAREAMMLGKPVICFIRPEWLESLRKELPDFATELPIISATPETVELILRDLIAHPEKRKEIGRRSREFAIKWHSDTVAGKRFDEIYSKLLNNDPQLLSFY